MSKLTLATIVIVLATAAVYARSVNYGFVAYDDPLYLTDHPEVKQGLNRSTINWALTGEHLCNWHPLTTLMYLTERQLFGFNARVFHFNNVLLHLANSVLLLWVLERMTNAAWRSAAVAALFALHPLHVESVAWVAERKDVLSTFFMMLTLTAYTRHAQRPSGGSYLLICISFAAGLMSKPMLVTLPLLLLLLDVWPMRRLVPWKHDAPREARFASITWKRALIEKLPLLALSACSSAVTFLVQRHCGAVATLQGVPLSLRVQNALISYCAYLAQTFWPKSLACFYPMRTNLSVWPVCLLVLLAVTILTLLQTRRRPYLAVGWAWYVITLLPVIGLVQVGEQSMADRYTYIPLIGIFAIVAWGAWDLVAGSRRGWMLAAVASAVVLSALAIRTFIQIGYWRDSEALFLRALEVTPRNANAIMYLGDVESRRGRMDLALPRYVEAQRYKPNAYDTESRLGMAYSALKDFESAKKAFGRAIAAVRRTIRDVQRIEHDDRYVETRYNLGVIALAEDDIATAAPLVEAAVAHNPKSATYRGALAVLRNKQGRYGDAEAEARRALEIDSTESSARAALVHAAIGQNKLEDAVAALKEVLKISPADNAARFELSAILLKLKREDEAITVLQEIARRSPNDSLPHQRLGIVHQLRGDWENAILHHRRAIELDPKSSARNNLAWLLATCPDDRFRDGREAVRLAEAVRKDVGDRPEVLDTLAGAYAQAGDFEKAVQAAELAAEIAQRDGQTALGAQITARLNLYRQRKPYRELDPSR